MIATKNTAVTKATERHSDYGRAVNTTQQKQITYLVFEQNKEEARAETVGTTAIRQH